MPLLGNQVQAKAEIIQALTENQDNSYWLAGEPGVGKTYITSSVCHDWLENHPNHHILIISPSNVIKKWHHVLKEYNPDVQIVKLTAKNINEHPADISILSNHNLKLLEKLDNHNFQFVAYDEFHEVQPGHRNFDRIAKFLNRDNENYNNARNYHPALLAITGTVFNQEYKKLLELIKMTNPSIYDRNDNGHQLHNIFKLNIFINQIWQYIATTINLKNVNTSLHKVEISQDIMPINLISLTNEEKAFYNFVQSRYAQINNSQTDYAADLLDFPSDDQFLTKHTRRVSKKPNVYEISQPKNTDYMLANICNILKTTGSNQYDHMPRKNNYIAALTLNKITLTNTHKFNQLKQIIKTNPDQSILVLLNSNSHLKRLEKAINQMTIRQTAILNPRTSPTQRANVINNFLNTGNDRIMIANANTIKTGIDLNSVNIIVWYQLLNNLSDILQTQRRAQRLNSHDNSKVYYLAYKDTTQEDLIEQLSKSNTNNAGAYGARSTDALSQLKGILFDQFQ